jgi:hypothetical protein
MGAITWKRSFKAWVQGEGYHQPRTSLFDPLRQGTTTVTRNRRLRMAQLATTMSCCRSQTKLVGHVRRGGALAERVE